MTVILAVIVVLALANRQLVTVQLLPEGMTRLMPGMQIDLPLYMVSLISIGVGLLLGYILEWLREHRHRRRAAQKAREAERLNREVENLRRETNTPKDDVLAIIGN